MIRPLRRVHRGVFVVLAAALPAFLVAAIRGRHPQAVQELPEVFLPVAPSLYLAGEDWLVYWVEGPPAGEGVLPAGAQLVGTRRSGALALDPPPGVTAVVYSLLEGRVVSDPLEGLRE